MDAKYNHREVEEKWARLWGEAGLYRYDPAAGRENTFVVDTPPPTVSGSLHIGHVFSYTHTDVIVRYQRMRGKSIFYPIGWDDNGLPTERRVQNYFGIRCDPHLPYTADWKPVRPENPDKQVRNVSRSNFIEACTALTAEDEAAFERLFRRIGQSYDWSLQYSTIDRHSRRLSQLSFLDLVEKGLVYSSDSPCMWDSVFRTAVAQAEVEDREINGSFYDLEFGVEGGGEFIIATTRPELLPACVAVVAHPEDSRYQHLFGKRAVTPLFRAPVPIQAAPYADPEKGSGILMVCTFGDIMDVSWWKEKSLPLKQVIGPDGRMNALRFGEGVFESLQPDLANSAYSQLAGLTVKNAHKKVVELLAAEGSAVSGRGSALKGDPKPVRHAVKFYEKGELPLEFLPARQWFIRILPHKEALIEQGRRIEWFPAHMLSRYEHWVQGLNQDWCISRQRYFGVPFPVWYPLDADSRPDYARPIFAARDRLPLDPMADCPDGFDPSQRGQPGGFAGDPDIMDTWATSSLTPQIQSHWEVDCERHRKLFPMDLRPQAHDIIRTWAFYTIAKAWMHENTIPWKGIVISGFITDPDRKKMSKSKGNAVTPEALIDEHSADAVRYWASRARLGMDMAFDPGLFKIGTKLVTKIFNASRFVLMQFERISKSPGDFDLREVNAPLDLAMLQEMRRTVRSATESLDKYDFGSALQSIEDFFWNYCDHYLELVKVRSYLEEDTPGRRSAFAALGWSLKTFLRLFAPFVPFIAEEVWASSFKQSGREASVHTAAWPNDSELENVSGKVHERAFPAAIEVTGRIRGAKTEARRNQRWQVTALEIQGPAENHLALKAVLEDVLRCGSVDPSGVRMLEGQSQDGGMFAISVTLAAGE